MAERYHKTPFQNSTPVLPSFWHLPTTGYGGEHVTSQHTIQVSVSSLPALPRDVSVPARIPFIIQYLCRLLVRFQGPGESRTRRESFSPPAYGKKNRAFLH